MKVEKIKKDFVIKTESYKESVMFRGILIWAQSAILHNMIDSDSKRDHLKMIEELLNELNK